VFGGGRGLLELSSSRVERHEETVLNEVDPDRYVIRSDHRAVQRVLVDPDS